jgi:hypothetical protein
MEDKAFKREMAQNQSDQTGSFKEKEIDEELAWLEKELQITSRQVDIK